MYIVPIAWLYVAFMMSVAEATNSNGTLLGACITFVLYGLMPVGLVMYIMGTPARKRALRAQEAAEQAAQDPDIASPSSSGPAPEPPSDSVVAQPDASRLPPTDPVTPVRKEP
jgi:hypothetical protein